MPGTRITRRQSAALLAAPFVLGIAGQARAQARTLKISHQFPGGTAEQGDFRDRLVRRFAAEVEKRSNGALKFEIYPNASLMRVVAQFGAVRRGALDLSLYPLSYAGGEVQELNVTALPALVTSYDQAFRWKNSDLGRELVSVLEKRGVSLVTWVWQAGGTASRAAPVVGPADVKGIKMRGGSRENDLMLKAGGAIVSSAPSTEIYAGMQTGALDAAVTSSTSLISFRLEEVSKNVTTARTGSWWFLMEPLIMSKQVLETLPAEQQKLILDVGRELEPWGRAEAEADDARLADIFGKAGVGVHDIPPAEMTKWRELARGTAWKDFAERSPATAALMRMAEAIA